MRCLATGCAGFIGSHLAEWLMETGDTVVGRDCFAGDYSRSIKERDWAALLDNPRFRLVVGDLMDLNLEGVLSGVDYVFHLAAQPGVPRELGIPV